MASKLIYYMERKSHFAKRFWQIETNKKSTVVRYGKIKLPDRGRLFSPRKHLSFHDALKFAKRNVKKKRQLGYVLKRGKTAKKFKPKDKRGKQGKKTATRKQKVAVQKVPIKKKTLVKNATNAVNGPAVAPPSLQKQDTLPVAGEARKSHSSSTAGLVKQRSLTVGSGHVYIPPESKWPVTVDMPVAWRFPFEQSGTNAFGIYVDENHCMFGHDDGSVIDLDETGKVKRVYKLPAGVKCITRDGEFLYVGCDNGALYDLTHGEPRKMCEIEEFGQVYWLDVLRGILCASDNKGDAAVVNYEGEIIWKKSSGGSGGWMIRMDDNGVYHGHNSGVTKYGIQNGKIEWSFKATNGIIFFGVQHENCVYFAEGKIARKIDKKSGKIIRTYKAGNTASAFSNEAACGLVFLGDGEHIRCCDEKTGKLVYVFNNMSDAGSRRSILSMKYHQGRLYCVGSGEFKVVDLSEAAIKTVMKKQQLHAVELCMDAAAPVIAPITRVDSVTSEEAAQGGIILQCVKEKGKLRIKALSDGYNKKWNCQFPKVIRKEGAKYLVEELRETKFFSGKYYRVFGFIKEIND